MLVRSRFALSTSGAVFLRVREVPPRTARTSQLLDVLFERVSAR